MRLAYVFGKSAARPAAELNPPSYELSKPNKQGDTTVTPKPWRDGAGFANPNGFQVFSMGEDGIPNTDDDLKGW